MRFCFQDSVQAPLSANLSLPSSHAAPCACFQCGLDLLDVVIEALELDCPRHVDELIGLEPLFAAVKV